MTETFKIYIPTPTLKRGVLEIVCKLHWGSIVENSADTFPRRFHEFDENSKWFRDRDAAVARSAKDRAKRIASLRKQLEKLEGFGPVV